MPDLRTIATYDAKAADYAARFAARAPDASLRDFIALMPPDGHVLDLGCGPASASAHMRAAGLVPDPVDASPKMVALANRTHDIGARVATFDDIADVGIYDGVWANFSLLHAARGDLPRHLAALFRALHAGGILHIGMKTGTGDGRDTLGRFYTYVTVDELRGLLEAAGFTVIFEEAGAEKGLAGTLDPFVVMRARKRA